MKLVTFSRTSKLLLARLKKVFEHTQTLSELPDLNSAQKERAVSLLEETNEKYSEFHKNLEKLLNNPNDFDSDEETSIADLNSRVDELVLEIRSILRPILPNVQSSNAVESAPIEHNNTQAVRTSNVRLPKINLKTFNGDLTQWISFHNLFETTVHSNNSLTNIEKFQFLISSLQDEPFNLVKSLPLTNQNYIVAYETLVQRYHNPRLLQSLHINEIINIPSCNETNVTDLRNFISKFNEHSSALISLNINIENDNPVLVTLLMRKFSIQLRTTFETKRVDAQTLPSPKEFIQFLSNECSFIENASLAQLNSPNTSFQRQTVISVPKQTYNSRHKNVTMTVQNVHNNQCSYCKGEHFIFRCVKFSKLKPIQRFNFTKSQGLCTNCLSSSHKLKECTSERTCKFCNKSHNSLLHFDSNYSLAQSKTTADSTQKQVSVNLSSDNKPLADNAPLHSAHTVNTDNRNNLTTTILGTVLVKVVTPNNNSIVARALLDSASSCSFINEDLANKLKLKRSFSKQSCQVNGISSASVKTKGATSVGLFTLGNELVTNCLPVLILDRITGDLPSCLISSEVKNSLVNFKLADPHFSERGPIQMLLGADIFMQIIKPTKVSLGDNMPYAMDTMFGFVILGKAPIEVGENHDSCVNNLTTFLTIHEDPLHELMTRFWQVEEPPKVQSLTDDELKCETHFLETYYRSPETGKYVVRLPFRENPDKLGESLPLAKQRFFSLENKLKNDPECKKLYLEFMENYKSEGHMTLCDSKTMPLHTPHYVLPHHCVLRDSSSTTRLRVVFDGSCKTTSGVSLNDILCVGPKLHNDIPSVVINFRRYRYVFTSDIKQMFRSIDLDENDKRFQLILWRDRPEDPLKIYCLNTVTYGLAPSPFLANRVIQQLTVDEAQSHPLASAALRDQIYVDDLALGSDTLQDAQNLQHDVIQLLQKGNFHLRKWTSNHKELLKNIPEDHLEKPVCFLAPDQPLVNVLGLQWLPSVDCFTYKISVPDTAVENPTKRTLLSTISRIYDPCGLISPVVFYGKTLIQVLWTLGINWDSPLPIDITNRWKDFIQTLPILEKLFLNRTLQVSDAVDTQLHGFCDSSELGYSSCVYLRCIDPDGNIRVTLIMAKTKVAPLKRLTIPRLELCGAFLLAQLMKYCSSVLCKSINFKSVHAWTDSSIVLSWLSTPPYKLKTYVANRVSQIQELVPPTAWSHVPSAQNPADCASRGLLPAQLLEHPLWWSGPEWLYTDSSKWPIKPSTKLEKIPETKHSDLQVLTADIQTPEEWNLLFKFSSWSTLQRVMGYILRFIHNTSHEEKRFGPITSDELKLALYKICHLVQRSNFATDKTNLLKNNNCSLKVQRLSPYVDDNDLIRVGGRLKHSSLSKGAKNPILLPKTHFITHLIIDFFHIKYLHAGPQLVQSLISQHFWILSARSLIRSRIHKCITCFRAKPQILFPKMGDLPADRINPAPAFVKTGVDYAGPMEIKVHTLRRAKLVKAYLCIFVCFVTKAVHIEVACDLTSNTFIAALTRFVSRRGIPTDIYLDNATNFVGASNQLNKLIKSLLSQESTKQQLHQMATDQMINFHFIPPSAPHHGGIWESAVKSAKTHLKRVMGNQTLTLDELQTLVVRIESVLNSRPLSPLSADPSELCPLTPGHFLIGRPLATLPEHNVENLPTNSLKRWQRIQAMTQSFWRRWQREYLFTLQQRPKWHKPTVNLKLNDLVLVHEPNTPPMTWSLGRISALFPGQDGVVRVIQLETTKGTITRPVVKVSPLPQEK